MPARSKQTLPLDDRDDTPELALPDDPTQALGTRPTPQAELPPTEAVRTAPDELPPTEAVPLAEPQPPTEAVPLAEPQPPTETVPTPPASPKIEASR